LTVTTRKRWRQSLNFYPDDYQMLGLEREGILPQDVVDILKNEIFEELIFE
jgi:hypothetical protein